MTTDFYKLPLARKELLTKSTRRFIFSTKGKDFSFFPGQFVTVRIGKETRDFSIASSPVEQDIIAIVTKEGKSDFKKNLFNVEKGDGVEFSSPRGGFLLDTKDAAQVFIAGGIGITPFYSMLKYAQSKKIGRPITLLASFSEVEDIIFREELESIQEDLQNVKVIYSVSSPKTVWYGERGRIQKDMLYKYVPDVFVPTYFIVGKVEMVDDMYEMLREIDIPSEKIRIEYFTGY